MQKVEMGLSSPDEVRVTFADPADDLQAELEDRGYKQYPGADEWYKDYDSRKEAVKEVIQLPYCIDFNDIIDDEE